MKKLIYASALCLSALMMQGCGNPEAVVDNAITPPAYPLVSIDPFTSAWSMTDRLYDEPVKHWTGKDFPLIGALKVDGTVYRFMGTEDVELSPIAPTSVQGDWTGKWTTRKPAGDWTSLSFNDSGWSEGPGAFGTVWNEPTAKTKWAEQEIWVRRTIELPESLTDKTVWFEYSNDDDAVFYVNGVKVFSTGPVCNKDAQVKLPAEAVATLKAGKNIITAECVNPVGNGLLDFGLLVQKDQHTALELTAEQTSVQVQATQTHYTFDCGPVELALTFMAPVLMDDLDLMSRPVNYITYKVNSKDGASHDVEVYMEAAQNWALNSLYQPSSAEAFVDGGLVFVKCGSKAQPILKSKGDDHRIDWGYFYLAADAAATKAAVGSAMQMRKAFAAGGFEADMAAKDDAKMAMVTDLGTVKNAEGKFLIGYDDIYSIQYFGENLRPYWNRKGDNTITGEFHAADKEYAEIMKRCYAFDRQLMNDGIAAGGQKYAELCAMVYRQTMHAHKLVEAPDGDLLWFSKENNSNGSIGTVDITYPSSPIFLVYNPDGNDISNIFTGQQQMIFLLLLKRYNENGMSSKRLSNILWPDKEEDKVKNSRGVAINNLRKSLSRLKGVSITFLEGRYRLEVDDSFYCDYLRVLPVLTGERTDLSEALCVLAKGGKFLSLATDPVFDSFKEKVETRIIELLYREIQKRFDNKEYKAVVEIADMLRNVDSLDEVALKYGVWSLKKLKKNEDARVRYSEFASEYRLLYGQDYSISYNKL